MLCVCVRYKGNGAILCVNETFLVKKKILDSDTHLSLMSNNRMDRFVGC